MVVYFGNNATNQEQKPIYGILASYDDEDNTTFWQTLELGTQGQRHVPISADTRPLEGPRKAPHYDVGDVQQNICKPSQLVEGADADICIVGEAYSNDQAWVEGAYCTAEHVLNRYFGLDPIIDDTNYPFICPA